MMIDPGKLNRRVRFERQAAGSGTSFSERDWEEIATVWASVKPVASREHMAADSMQASVTHTVLVRWRSDLALSIESAQWRVIHQKSGLPARVLAITGPGRDIEDAGRWLIFDCVEGLADGH